MPSQPVFRFKQFAVWLDKCAMKVNTDGVLLGAWADAGEAETILDIGTGTGVLAMMMAQKNKTATIDAIDIDESAYLQSSQNFRDCTWSSRLIAYHTSLQDFAPELKYDVIISNPPYFIDDSHTMDHRKNIAKHGVSLGYEDLIIGIDRLLSADGKAFLVLPIFNEPILQPQAQDRSLYIAEMMEVTAVAGKLPYLALIKLERTKATLIKGGIDIQNADGEFTDEYKALTKDFYLKF